MDWCTIESDPAVFTELIEKWGFKNLEVEEIFSLDDDAHLASLKPIYGFVFLFKWVSKPKKAEALREYDSSLYFANQVITNACATQALLSILLNNEDKIQVPAELEELRSFGLQLDPQSRGLTIGQCQRIRESHNSFARPEPFLKMHSKHGVSKEDVFHFVAFIHKNNKVYELDGLQEGPILVADNVPFKDWTGPALRKIQEKVAEYGDAEIKFNLMVVKNSILSQIKHQIAEVDTQLVFLRDKLQAAGSPPSQVPADLTPETAGLPLRHEIQNAIPESFPDKLSALLVEKSQLENELFPVLQLRKDRREENERRKHNYLPFIFELLKMAAERGELDQLYQNASKAK